MKTPYVVCRFLRLIGLIKPVQPKHVPMNDLLVMFGDASAIPRPPEKDCAPWPWPPQFSDEHLPTIDWEAKIIWDGRVMIASDGFRYDEVKLHEPKEVTDFARKCLG